MLLLRFAEHRFRGLPWEVDRDPAVLGDELRTEIEEALDQITDHARLTPLGAAAVRQFARLYRALRSRWAARIHP